jgi:NAD(P)-dependent dehydrogenase (short-subunit alcohol dehydrogenase family)
VQNRLQGKVVVVTGASSGLGRATAMEFARQGSAVVVAARRRDELDATAALCRACGADPLIVVTDVTEEDQVARLVATVLDRWGRIDVWVNNAGVTLFAPLETRPFEEHRRVIETNLFGAMFAARSVLPVFREQRRGVLINVGSILSKVGQPFVPSYVISKFALRGLSEALRAELADERDIHVCSIFPYAIDTQHFEVAANFVGRQARAMPPTQSPEAVARGIVALAEHPRREQHVPRAMTLGLALHWLAPRTVERLLSHALHEWHFSDAVEPRTSGNLFEAPAERAAVHGSRGPQLGAPALVAWVLRDLVSLELGAAREQLRRGIARGRALIRGRLWGPAWAHEARSTMP